MLPKIRPNVMPRPNSLKPNLLRAFYHRVQELDEKLLPSEWYRAAYAKLIKLTHMLKNVEKIDGRIMHIDNDSTVIDTYIINQMHSFNSLAKALIRRSSFDRTNSVTLNSLTKVCNLLNISAQQRKNVRLTICPQVTQHHIWRGALEEVLRDLKHEMQVLNSHSPSFQMGEQILSSCIEFFSTAKESPSWMKPTTMRKVDKPSPSRMWGEVLEMFVDLSKCLEREEKLAYHVSKIEVMKEGLYQIKDIIIERDISYKEVRRQDCLVQRKLSKCLGHSSKCLFALLTYYLYGSVRDVEVEIYEQQLGARDGRSFMRIGKILGSCDEETVLNGIKQLNRVLEVLKFVRDSAEMSEKLEVQSHLWCVGAEDRTLTYRGNVFFVHGFKY